MASKNRVAIVYMADAGSLALFTTNLLWRSVDSILADALIGAGVNSLLVISDEPVSADRLPAELEVSQIKIADYESYSEFISGADSAVYFTSPALIDTGAISELFSCAIHLGPTLMVADGTPVAYGISGHALENGAALINTIIKGETEGFRVIENSSGGLCMPIRDLLELNLAETFYRNRVNMRLLDSGVRMVGPETCFIADDAKIEPGVTILPGTVIRTGCSVGRGTQLGPYVYIRENCHIGRNCRIGDFVELKNTTIADGTKVSHLTYVGDADVGERVNFGCGTVTVNYNGITKSRTVIGDDAFIGCNTNLIAPVNVGKGAYTAAGSTITGDVPDGALAIARERQVNKPGYAARLMKKFRERRK